MSVLVKGMRMPKNCCICWLSSHDMCLVCGKDADDWFEERPSYCPLVELPDHGDLVDVDALKEECKEPYVWWETETQMARILKDAPVVIPAERREE